LPDRQLKGIAGFPRLANRLGGPLLWGQIAAELGSALMSPVCSSVIHNDLWAAMHQGPASC